MVPRGQSLDRQTIVGMALCLLATMPLARAGDDAHERPLKTAAPLEIPHTLNLVLAEKARKKDRKPGNIENHTFLDLTPGLTPLVWPKNTDVRARILTTDVKSTPGVGWLAENISRSKKENGWCLEADPGEGEYIVFYRYHPRK